jgi:hypothetical protein
MPVGPFSKKKGHLASTVVLFLPSPPMGPTWGSTLLSTSVGGWH